MQFRDFNGAPFELSDSWMDGVTGYVPGTPQYQGYLSPVGNWVIYKWDQVNGTHRYKAGKKDYTANWIIRESLVYVYYNQITINY